jgi:hypothetical protein
MLKEKIKKPETITGFTVKYSVSLFLGWIFAGLFVGLVVTLVGMLVTGDYSVLANEGGAIYAGLISSLIVFGALYLSFTHAAGRNLRKHYNNHLWVRILAIVYASGLGIAAISFLVTLITPLVNAGVGVVDISDKAVLSQIISSAVAFVLLAKMIGYALQVPKWCGRNLYVWCLLILSAATVALFMIFPASFVRDATKDQKIIDDLTKISRAIGRYSDANRKLPASLGALGEAKLNRDIDKYDYELVSQVSLGSATGKYQLCSDDFLVDTKSSDYWNNYNADELQIHTTGYNCFDMSEYVYVSTGTNVNTENDNAIVGPNGTINYFED